MCHHFCSKNIVANSNINLRLFINHVALRYNAIQMNYFCCIYDLLIMMPACQLFSVSIGCFRRFTLKKCLSNLSLFITITIQFMNISQLDELHDFVTLSLFKFFSAFAYHAFQENYQIFTHIGVFRNYIFIYNFFTEEGDTVTHPLACL